MFAHAHTIESEIVKWLALLILAGALVLLLIGTAMGDEAVRPPGLLPPETAESAMPLPPAIQPPVFPPPSSQLVADLWHAIELHKAGRIDEAIVMWEEMRLPGARDQWRLLMLGVAYMQKGADTSAEATLLEARALAAENPVVYYTLGLVLLGQAEDTDEWYDATGIDPFRLASVPAQDAVPRRRSMCQLAAMMAFERAIDFADRVDFDEPLVAVDESLLNQRLLTFEVVSPTVRDAIDTFGVEKFESRSHLALGLLHMQRGGLNHAESHLDSAAGLGAPTGNAFRELGRNYSETGAANEAMRAHLKAFSHGGGVACLEDALREFRRAMMGR